MNMHKLLLTALIITLSACGGGGNETQTTDTTTICSKGLFVTSGSVSTSSTSDCIVTYTSDNSEYTIPSNVVLDEMIILGSNNLINFDTGSVIGKIIINGNDNTLNSAPVTSVISDNGLGNSI